MISSPSIPSTRRSLPPHSAGEYFRIEGETLEQRLGREGRLAPTAVAALGVALLDSGHGALPPAQIFVARSGESDLVKPLGARPDRVDLYALGTLLRRCLGGADADPGLVEILDKAVRFDLDAFELRARLAAWRAEAERVERLLRDFLGVERTRRRSSVPAATLAPASRAVPPPPPPPPPPPSMPMPSLRLNLQGVTPLFFVESDA